MCVHVTISVVSEIYLKCEIQDNLILILIFLQDKHSARQRH